MKGIADFDGPLHYDSLREDGEWHFGWKSCFEHERYLVFGTSLRFGPLQFVVVEACALFNE